MQKKKTLTIMEKSQLFILENFTGSNGADIFSLFEECQFLFSPLQERKYPSIEEAFLQFDP